MTDFLHQFCHKTSGAVTVDWVVLTAAVIGLSVMAAIEITSGTVALGSDVGTFMATDEVFIQNQ